MNRPARASGVSIVTKASQLQSKLESGMVVSTIKKAEDKDAVLIRVFNPSRNESDGGFLTYNDICKNVFKANLKESVLSSLSNTKGKIELGNFTPCEVKTFIIE